MMLPLDLRHRVQAAYQQGQQRSTHPAYAALLREVAEAVAPHEEALFVAWRERKGIAKGRGSIVSDSER